jgi:hypothetical protein
MPITRTPIIDDSGSGLDGTVIDNAWKQEFYNQIDAVVPVAAAWTAVPFNAAHFGGRGALVWTVTAGNLLCNQYLRHGPLLVWSIAVNGSTLAGTPNNLLHLTLPAGMTSQIQFNAPTRCAIAMDAGTIVEAMAYVESSVVVGVQKLNGANWTLGAPCNVWLTITMQVL